MQWHEAILGKVRRQVTGQVILLVGIWLFVWGLHAHNDGLWFQGDAPRHAANGLFWKEYLSSSSLLDPKGFALRYYARYPDIAPAVYPPVFHLLEAFVYSVVGPSPYAAKTLVMLFSLTAGLYTLAWLRLWLTPAAGWVAGLLLLQPAMIQFSHAIMLNVPALALGLATLYHARRGLTAPSRTPLSRHWYAAAILGLLTTLTYYPAAVVLFVLAAWIPLLGRWSLFGAKRIWILLILAALVLLPSAYVVSHWAPRQLGWLIPSKERFLDISSWEFYAVNSPEILQPTTLLLAAAGAAAGLASRRWRRETAVLLAWAGACYVVFSLIEVKEPRYILLVSVPIVCLAALAVIRTAEWIATSPRNWTPGLTVPVLLTPILLVQGWSALSMHMPEVLHFRELAAFMKDLAPEDPVLYGGVHDGVFTFYIQADDPEYKRRVVLPNNVLADAKNSQEAVELLRKQGGCHWLLIEKSSLALWRYKDEQLMRVLRETVAKPEFRVVCSYPIGSHNVDSVDIIQFLLPIEKPATTPIRYSAEHIDVSVAPIER
jgi:hypothetical protein